MKESAINNIEFLSQQQRCQNIVKIILAYGLKTKELLKNRKNDTFTKRIGNTIFKVRVFFDETSTEPMEEKVMHLVNTDIAAMTAERSIYE